MNVLEKTIVTIVTMLLPSNIPCVLRQQIAMYGQLFVPQPNFPAKNKQIYSNKKNSFTNKTTDNYTLDKRGSPKLCDFFHCTLVTNFNCKPFSNI